MKTIFDRYSKEEIEEKINIIYEFIHKKYSDEEIISKINCDNSCELLSIAKARIKSNESKTKFVGDVKYFNLDDLRFSTPKDVADYRAMRLKCDKIVDLCSGIGIQANSFSKVCKEILEIEIDPRKVRYAKENFSNKNLCFIEGDVLDNNIINDIKEFEPNIIFCDPERLEKESERNIESIKPNIKKIIEIYSKITPNICIEMPPQLELKKLEELGNFEAEYLSFNNKLNRLNLYLGNLKRVDISVADISGIRIEKNEKNKAKYSSKPLKYIYEVSSAITKAGLENEFSNLINAYILFKEKDRLLLTSNELTNIDEAKVFSKVYRIIGISDNINKIIEILRKNNFGKVILKKSINPALYWKEREKYQKNLKGKKEAVLFEIKSKYNNELICEEI